MALFKYVDTGGIPILKDSEIRITNPCKLNDPFEFLSKQSKITPELVKDRLNNDLQFRQLLKTDLLKKSKIQEEQQFGLYMERHTDELIEILLKNRALMERLEDPHSLRNDAADVFGITCFSKAPDNILMWSHYAEKHKGFVLEFDHSELDKLLYNVIYCSERVEYNEMHPTATKDDKYEKLLLTKSLDWSYEKEVRAIVPWGMCYQKGGHHYYKFDPKNLKSIILGTLCEDKDDILGLVETKYPHARVFEATLSKVNYGLDFYELSP